MRTLMMDGGDRRLTYELPECSSSSKFEIGRLIVWHSAALLSPEKADEGRLLDYVGRGVLAMLAL
jgi:hypothetical protein